VAQRWVRIDSEPRRPQAPRTVEKPRRKQSATEAQAFRPLGRTACAGEADAPQALATFAQGLRATRRPAGTLRHTARDAKPGRPGKVMGPEAQVDDIEGALPSSLAARDALVAHHRCGRLATNELDDRALSARERLAGDQGQKPAARGVRCLKAPRLLASSCYRKKPERIRALWRVMTVCVWGDAALEYRLRTALTAQQATFPNHQGPPMQNPTARWVFQSWVGIHLRLIPGEWPLVRNRTAEHQHLLRLLGRTDELFYS
jgi:hypothetical protein